MRNLFSKKSLAFKIVYLLCSLAVLGYTIYLFISHLIYCFGAELNFDDLIILFATLFAVLFEISIIGFIVRSFKLPTILMKNLVFKWDGTPYLPGILGVLAGVVICGAMFVIFAISAYGTFIKLPQKVLYFITDVFLIMFHNLLFVEIYFITFRHESGSFTVI